MSFILNFKVGDLVKVIIEGGSSLLSGRVQKHNFFKNEMVRIIEVNILEGFYVAEAPTDYVTGFVDDICVEAAITPRGNIHALFF